jgi:DNA-3-methyladenine glycosylase
MALRRGRFPRSQWCNGPAKLCQALGIDREMNGAALFDDRNSLWIEEGIAIKDSSVSTGPRVGIDSVPEPWHSQPWRYLASLPNEHENG